MSSKTSSSNKVNSNIVRIKSQSIITLMTSDLLQSQVYPADDELAADLYDSLVAMNQPGYDSDKEYNSSSESGDDVAESSLLAKTSVLSAGGGGGEGMEGVSLSPLVMTSRSIAPSSTETVDSLANGYGGGDQLDVGVARDESGLVVKVEPASDEPRYSVLGSVPVLDNHGNQQMLNSYQDSMTASFDPTHSIGSHYSEESFGGDVNFTSSLKATPTAVLDKSRFSKQQSLPVGMKLGHPLLSRGLEDPLTDEEHDGVDVETDTESVCSSDPQVLAVNLHVSQVAADCLCWLVRRLGPLLATHHIVRPLIDNLHRSFTGILHLKGREVAVLRCLTSFAEYYGEIVVMKMYIPRAENMVQQHVCVCVHACMHAYMCGSHRTLA